MSAFEAERIARTDEERTFKVNGVTFKLKPAMHAKRLAEFQDRYFDVDTRGVAAYDLAVGFVRDALEPGFVEEWDKAIDVDATLPLSMHQLDEILSFALGAVSGRPFEKPQDSGTT